MEQVPPVSTADDEIDLRDLILPLVENWRRIAAAVAAAAVLAASVSFLMTPTYESEIRLRIVPLRGIPDVGWTEPPPAAYEALTQAPGFRQAVARAFDPSIEDPMKWFDEAVDVAVSADAQILTVTARADTPTGARDLAGLTATELIVRTHAMNVETLRQLTERALAQARDDLEAVSAQLAATPRYIWVQEALTREAARLGEALHENLSDQQVADLMAQAGTVAVVRRELNPLWQSLNQRAANLRARMDYLERQLDRLGEEQEQAAYASLVRFHDAPLPLEPVAPRKVLNTVLGALLGGMLAVFWVFFRRMWAGIMEPAAATPPQRSVTQDR